MKNALTTKPVIEYLPDRPVEEQEGPEFMETVGAMLGMRYDHVIDKISFYFRSSFLIENDFNSKEKSCNNN